MKGRGLTAVELVFGLIVVGAIVLYLMIAMPRGRESSRRLTCQRNLMRIGMALSLYHEAAGQLPTARLDEVSPLAAMLDTLGQSDFLLLTDRRVAPPRNPNARLVSRRVPGFVCPSDPDAMGGPFAAPISYRADAGDTTDGQGGPFALGRRITFEEVETARGAAFVAAFTERLVGKAPPEADPLRSYTLVNGPVAATGCDGSDRRGDAGSSWLTTDWRSTLFTHLPTPGATPSCIAADGRTAFIGASSAHREGVNVLLLDGSLKTYRPSVAPQVWRALGTIEAANR